VKTFGRRGAFACAIVFGITVVGCSSGSSSKSSPTSKPGSSATTAGGSSAAPTGVKVDLVITGDKPATIKGTKGRCRISNPAMVGYDFSGADYPALGATGDLSINGPQQNTNGFQEPSNLKLVMPDSGFLDTDGSGITISADGKHVTLDAAIGGGTGDPSATNTLTDHITGTITCS
jgi:hypothetical protein